MEGDAGKVGQGGYEVAGSQLGAGDVGPFGDGDLDGEIAILELRKEAGEAQEHFEIEEPAGEEWLFEEWFGDISTDEFGAAL